MFDVIHDSTVIPPFLVKCLFRALLSQQMKPSEINIWMVYFQRMKTNHNFCVLSLL